MELFLNCSYDFRHRRKHRKKNLLCVANAMKYLKRTQNIYNTIMKDTKHEEKEKAQK